MEQITLDKLAAVNKASIRRAGARYTPEMNPNAPNLEIENLVEAFEMLALSSDYRTRIATLESSIRKAWIGAARPIRGLFDTRFGEINGGANLLAQLKSERPGTSRRTIYRISQLLRLVYRKIAPYERQVYNPPTNSDGSEQSREERAQRVRELEDFLSSYNELQALIRSPHFSLTLTNRLFLLGTWGTGKTHLLCDITRKRMEQGAPTLLLLAQTFGATSDPLLSACKVSGLCRHPEKLLSSLNRLGKKNGSRAFLIIDAINEGDRPSWFKNARRIARLLKNYPYVALVLSCRTPFAPQVIPLNTRGEFVELVHNGFVDIEFDAQREFFKHYSIPMPHLPLLAPEFSKPLFLKILCETISTLSKRSKQKRINEFAAGHKGMTKLLEDFVFEIGRQIEADFGLPAKTCWILLKGLGDQNNRVGIAPQMAANGTDYLSREECLNIIAVVTKLKRKRAEDFLVRAMADGLLAEDSIYDGTWLDVVRLPYQRFSDHLISRHLLSQHLVADTAADVRKAFKGNQPLGRAFEMDEWGNNYRMPGIASAIMLEFPERVKRSSIPQDERELYFYLPKKNQNSVALADVFIDGLLWRSVDSFSKQTDRIVSHFLKFDETNDMLEALTCLASRTGHPYSAKRLFSYLSEKTLVERDLFWSEFLRSREPTSAVYRVLEWVQAALTSDVSEETATNLVYLCSTFLTTTVQPLRDKATHCLVLLGEKFPKSLFSMTVENLSFNDPYVVERLLGASYGVLMRVWAFPPAALGKAVLPLASALSKRLSGSEETPPIEHILMRDYATGICELAAKVVTPREAVKLRPPLEISTVSTIPDADSIATSDVQRADSAIRMDFDNYTTGRLVSGRRNYDENHLDYQRTQRQIRWRILDLGWSVEKFQKLDRNIANSNFHRGRGEDSGKTDRYGKKYSWIAFFEVAGRLLIDGKLPDRDNPRISDSNIDPSFPDAGLSWKPPVDPLFRVRHKSVENWALRGLKPDYRKLLFREEVDGHRGPWVLLQGYISEVEHQNKREAFTFLRGLLVAKSNVNRIEKMVADVEYPGNRAIPDPIQDHYIFAGEIGWSRKVEHWLRRANGSARAHTVRAFDQTEHKVVLKPFGSLSESEKFQAGFSSIIAKLRGDKDFKQLDIPPDQLVPINEYIQIPGVSVEIPTMEYSWESYHSAENTGGTPIYPSAAIAEFLQLRKFGSGVDMFDGSKKLATLYRVAREQGDESQFELLYLRADLMAKYLSKVRRTLIWINWGERGLHYSASEADSLRDDPKMRKVWDSHAHIHKQFVRWERSL